MQILRNPDEFARLLALNAPPGIVADSFDAARWLANPAHFALAQGDDLAMFEAKGEWPGPLTGHIFFKSRGRKALSAARMMLGQAFAFGATRILGETPAHLPHVLRFERLLGFTPYGEAERPMGRVILVALECPHPLAMRAVA